MSELKPYRDILVAALDNWIAAEMLADSSAKNAPREHLDDLVEAAVAAYNKATSALSTASHRRTAVAAQIALPPVSQKHEVPLVEQVFPAEDQREEVEDDIVASLPLPPTHPVGENVVVTATTTPGAGESYSYTWENLPQWFKDRVAAHDQAYRGGRDTQRQYELWNGGWATLYNKMRVMVYRNHAFEAPTDRHYATPGPLKHIGLYNRTTHSVEPSTEVPEIPQTLEGYPWVRAFEAHYGNKKALGLA